MKRFFALLLALCLLAPAAYAVSARDMMEQCEAYASAGNYDAALACFELAKLSDPDVQYDPYMMGPVWLYTGHPDYARQCAQDAVAAEPLSARAWQLMYDVHSTLGDQAEAEKAQLYLSVLQAAEASDAAIDSVLAKLFERGNITLKKQSFFNLHDTPTPHFVSPDGQTGVFFPGVHIAPRGDVEKAVQASVSATRGVPDTYGKAADLMPHPRLQRFADSPAVWSPDGRYVTFAMWEPALMQARAVVDPFVIDTHTGEWIIFETTEGTNIIKGGIAMLHAAFSADGSKLYYACVKRTDDSNYAIHCADLATGDVSVLFQAKADYFPSYPGLCLTSEGSLLQLELPNRSADFVGLNIFTADGTTWQRDLQHLNLRTGEWYARYLQHSAVTDYTIINGSTRGGSSGENELSSFKAFHVQDDTINQEEAALQYVIHGAEAPAILALTTTEYMEYLQDTETLAMSNWHFNVVRMSPGGKFALIGCMKNGEHALLLVRLEDMACQTIALPDGMQPGLLGSQLSKGTYAAGLTWAGENEIITLDGETQLALYTLE